LRDDDDDGDGFLDIGAFGRSVFWRRTHDPPAEPALLAWVTPGLPGYLRRRIVLWEGWLACDAKRGTPSACREMPALPPPIGRRQPTGYWRPDKDANGWAASVPNRRPGAWAHEHVEKPANALSEKRKESRRRRDAAIDGLLSNFGCDDFDRLAMTAAAEAAYKDHHHDRNRRRRP
jgi:hypothetical protein